MMLLLSSGFLVIVFTRKAKSSFIWWWSSFWSWLMCRPGGGCRLHLSTSSSLSDCDQQQRTRQLLGFFSKSGYFSPRPEFLNDPASTSETSRVGCGICLAPPALVCWQCCAPESRRCRTAYVLCYNELQSRHANLNQNLISIIANSNNVTMIVIFNVGRWTIWCTFCLVLILIEKTRSFLFFDFKGFQVLSKNTAGRGAASENVSHWFF